MAKGKSQIYDKRNDFTFPIVNVPFISSNIPASPAYGAYISQIIRYARPCAQYSDFLDKKTTSNTDPTTETRG
jgi:hypothetical protein